MKHAATVIAFLSLVFLPWGAAAACGEGNTCVSWDAVDQRVDGTQISSTSLVKYRIYRGAKGAAQKTLVLETTTLSWELIAEPRGEQCYQVTAVEEWADGLVKESDPSAEACKYVTFPGPSDGSIVAPSDGSIVTEPPNP